jgi:hypothetical protein
MTGAGKPMAAAAESHFFGLSLLLRSQSQQQTVVLQTVVFLLDKSEQLEFRRLSTFL